MSRIFTANEIMDIMNNQSQQKMKQKKKSNRPSKSTIRKLSGQIKYPSDQNEQKSEKSKS